MRPVSTFFDIQLSNSRVWLIKITAVRMNCQSLQKFQLRCNQTLTKG